MLSSSTSEKKKEKKKTVIKIPELNNKHNKVNLMKNQIQDHFLRRRLKELKHN